MTDDISRPGTVVRVGPLGTNDLYSITGLVLEIEGEVDDVLHLPVQDAPSRREARRVGLRGDARRAFRRDCKRLRATFPADALADLVGRESVQPYESRVRARSWLTAALGQAMVIRDTAELDAFFAPLWTLVVPAFVPLDLE